MPKVKPVHAVAGRNKTTVCGAKVDNVEFTRLMANVTCKKCLARRPE